jgi:hypothetical protein
MKDGQCFIVGLHDGLLCSKEASGPSQKRTALELKERNKNISSYFLLVG